MLPPLETHRLPKLCIESLFLRSSRLILRRWLGDYRVQVSASYYISLAMGCRKSVSIDYPWNRPMGRLFSPLRLSLVLNQGTFCANIGPSALIFFRNPRARPSLIENEASPWSSFRSRILLRQPRTTWRRRFLASVAPTLLPWNRIRDSFSWRARRLFAECYC